MNKVSFHSLMRVPIQLFYVTYEQGDFLGFLLALASLTPMLVVVAQVTAVIITESSQRRCWAIWLLLGQILNEIINLILKRIFRQSRPITSDRLDYGMPSSHAQFSVFLAFALLFILYCHQSRFDKRMLFSLSLLSLLYPVVVCYSRVYLGYHDFLQVGAGILVGLAVGLLAKDYSPSKIDSCEKIKQVS